MRKHLLESRARFIQSPLLRTAQREIILGVRVVCVQLNQAQKQPLSLGGAHLAKQFHSLLQGLLGISLLCHTITVSRRYDYSRDKAPVAGEESHGYSCTPVHLGTIRKVQRCVLSHLCWKVL